MSCMNGQDRDDLEFWRRCQYWASRFSIFEHLSIWRMDSALRMHSISADFGMGSPDSGSDVWTNPILDLGAHRTYVQVSLDRGMERIEEGSRVRFFPHLILPPPISSSSSSLRSDSILAVSMASIIEFTSSIVASSSPRIC